MIPLFTPSKWSPEDLKSMFISKKGIAVLERMRKDLEKRTGKGSNQHYLVLGPRGIGKSHLLANLYYTIKETPKVRSKWIPLWFSEEEYSITSLRDLMERLLEEAIQELSATEGALAEELENFLSKMQSNGDNEEVVEMSMARFMDLEKRLQRRFVLLFENFNLFLKDIGPMEEKKLRSLLMNETVFLFICSAPTLHHYLKDVADPRNALYNLFDVHYLNELSLEECRKLIDRQCARDGFPQLCDLLKRDKSKLKGIYRLAGGNPRLVLMFYQITSSLTSLPELEETFGELLEKLTPYFQARTEGLSTQQRKILIAFAEKGENLTPAEIGVLLHLKTNHVTAQIKNLMDYGFLRLAAKEGTKRGTYYELAERIYRYWHQSRTSRGKRVITGIVDFISFWFSYEELKDMEREWSGKLEENRKGREANLIKKRLEYIQEGIKYKEMYLKGAEPTIPPSPPGMGKWFEKGVQYFKQGDFQRAVECFDKAIKIKPDSYQTWNNMGMAYGIQGDFKKAVECFEKAIKIKPDDHKTCFNLGNAYGIQGDFKKAVECYDKAIKIKPDSYQTWNNMGMAYGIQGDFKKAVECFEKIIKIKPDYHEAWNNMGNAYDDHGDFKKAVECYEKAIRIKPDCHEAWYNMGRTCDSHGKLKKAVECYEKAIKIKPDYHEAWNNMGVDYGKQGNYPKALECFEEAIKILPDKYSAWNNLGNAYDKQGNLKKGIECYERAAKINPGDFGALLNICALELRLKNRTKALYRMEEALALMLGKWARGMEESLMGFILKILKMGEYDFAKILWEILENKMAALEPSQKATIRLEFLEPFKILTEYLRAGDKNLLDRMPEEIRETIKEMALYVKSKDSPAS